jgi:flagellar motility protein MotE (MotC chaperone)
MRAIWIILSTLALANMMALVVVVGWLASTNRLSRERVDAVREIFVETAAQEEVREADGVKQAEQAAVLADIERKKGFPPLTAEQRLDLVREYADLIQQRTERTRRETQDLINTLMVQQSRLQQERLQLTAERQAFETMRTRITELEGSEQFQKALKIYQTVKPDIASAMLMELVARNELDQVVAYFNSMSPRTASRIITELKQTSSALAADLVERLRVHGLEAAPSAGVALPAGKAVADGAAGG